MPEVYDSGDEKQVRKRRTKAQLQREKELAELMSILETKPGRAFTWRLLNQCGVFKTTFANDANLTAFNEGKRQMGLWLLSEIMTASPNSYSLMQAENFNG